MMLGSRCTTCGCRVPVSAAVECEACGRTLHDRCAEYDRRFECPDCADELDVGAVEL